MSALAKPMIHTNDSINKAFEGANASPLVNIERVTSIDVVDTPEVANYAGSGKKSIVFTLAQNPRTGTIEKVYWNFEDKATLDAEYAKIITTASTIVA